MLKTEYPKPKKASVINILTAVRIEMQPKINTGGLCYLG